MNKEYDGKLVPEYKGNHDVNMMISTVDSFIRKEYLCELEKAQIVPVPTKLSEIKMGKNVRLFKVMSLAYASSDDVYEKITSIYNALAGFSVKQILILDSTGYQADLYLGVASNDVDKLGMEFETFKGSFLGNFPGGKISVLSNTKNEELLKNIFGEPNTKIASVSALNTVDSNTKNVVYGMERLVDGMYGKPFTMLLISDAVRKSELSNMRQGMEAMYTELSPFRHYSVSINSNESESYTESFNVTKSESVTEGKSITENTTFGKTKNKSETIQTAQAENEKERAKNQLLGTATSLAAIMSGLGGADLGLLQGLFYGGNISSIIGSVQTLINGVNIGNTKTESEGESVSISFSEAETSSRQEGFSVSKGVTDGSTRGTGKTIQMNYENKSIVNLLEVLDRQIKRLQHIEEVGGFGWAAYFVTGDNTTAHIVANMYRSLLGSGNSLGQNNAINVWSDESKVERISEYLKRMNHPVFHFESRVGYPTFTASSIVAADEFPRYASLPQKSLRGLPVTIHAEFGRNVMMENIEDSDLIEIGNIYHMGKKEMAEVFLSKENLRGHMFVAGATGMGKSNFCYGLLHRLYEAHVKFMVIEPAKGEYHKVFGGFRDVYTFGTNPMLMPLLKINPFSFPDGIHVTQHINSLLEIFNSCWPMYAAMPAVLKESVERIYKNCGYNLITGRSNQRNCFPTFDDLLEVLPKTIQKTEFSGEVKGNYIGSLVTRVSSLTDGIYRCIFEENEIDNRILFDENVLIDLSRIGSAETKSLIMGLLIMKQQEYRATTSQMNMPLRHVTVLEEAHHLLKANTASSAEGVNLRAMSLEMLTNAIAEMRTYGEGFLIADQSPSLMDTAVIRNTNTKIIFKLQENADRQTIGNALSLTSEQINELSRLERGVAVVYQSNWDNPVLSKINYFDTANFQPYVPDIELPDIDDCTIYSQLLAILLQERMEKGKVSSLNFAVCKDMMRNEKYIDGGAKKYLEVIKQFLGNEKNTISFSNVCRYIDQIIDSKNLMNTCGNTDDLETWSVKAKEYISSRVRLSDDEINELLLLCINIRANDIKEMKKFYFRYFAFINKAQK